MPASPAGTIYFGRFGRDVPLVPATAVQLGAAAVLTVALTILLERPHAVWTFPAVASVAWNVIAVSIGAMALYYYMLNHGTAGRVAANFYLIPGTVALLGVGAPGGTPDPAGHARLRHCLGRGVPGGAALERG